MQLTVILRITGMLLMVFSLTMLTPVIVAYIYDEPMTTFFGAFGITAGAGAVIFLSCFWKKGDLRNRDAFVITVLLYLVLGIVGALPFYLSEEMVPSFTDAVFESLSGLTTTGATVVTGLDHLPRSILYYRQQLQWLGGMGIIVLAVALLPFLGVGGLQLYRAETPGPVKDNKLTPRITETAKALWYIYASFTALCALAYWLAGMSVFDAIAHSFSTVAIGGFSTHDQSLGFFDSGAIEAVAVVFMLISALNFSLHFIALRNRSVTVYMSDPEVRAFLAIVAIVSITSVCTLYLLEDLSFWYALRAGVLQTVSLASTTGFTTTNFADWPSFLPYLVFLTAFIGGCAGSTAGGIKVIRVLLVYLQGQRELSRMVHPNAIISLRLQGRMVPDRVVEAVWGFFSVYIMVFVLLMLAVLGTNVDFETAFSAVGACLSNLGPGLSQVAFNYTELSAVAKWILCLAMLLGRLEIATFLVLLTAVFWRR